MIRASAQRLARGLWMVVLLALGGCAGTYFRDAGPPPAAPVQHDLARLPFSEYWTGIVFNGEKIGFTRLAVAPAPGAPGRYVIRSEASFVLRFMGIEKKVTLKAVDTVGADLTLVRFSYDYGIDGSNLKVDGGRRGGELVATIVTGGSPTEQRLPLEGKLYPSSIIALYPVVQGLSVGREFDYQVYNGETQSLADVSQRIVAYENSEFFDGSAFKVETGLGPHRATTWIDHQGRPVFELAMSGVMISALEEPARAKRYVALAALNKQESLIDFSIVRPDTPIPNPRDVSLMKVALNGMRQLPPSDRSQHCVRAPGETVCEIRRSAPEADPAPADPRYLSPSITVQSHDPSIRRTAREIVAGEDSPEARAARIVRWMDANVEKAPIDVFSALDVLEKRKAECQGNAYLYTALARAAGIPTRMVSGLAYSRDFDGFLYHSWAESFLNDRWVAVDPTFGQTSADATHIKLLEGETLADLMPMIDWVGKLKIRVLAIEH
jgi:hypothetical protein